MNINGTCVGCTTYCSNCTVNNITHCTSCAPGLSLVNSKCISCPEKCRECSGKKCTTCIFGYTPNSNGECILSCEISCATCADNRPSRCLTCYTGAKLVDKKCVQDLSCNNDSSCTDCGQALGYYRVGSSCLPCPISANCLQCDMTSPQECLICENGFYVNTNMTCSKCNSQCIQCSSADICSACIIGFTLSANQTTGQCLACLFPCLTCIGIVDYCTSCATGFTKYGWKCVNNTKIKFTMTLTNTPEQTLSQVQDLTKSILRAAGEKE